MTQKGRETYLSDYMDQAKKGLRNLHGKDRKAMDIFFSRVRSHAVYFIIDNLASNASDKELNALNVYAEGFLRPPYDVVVLAVDCINSAGRTTPVLIFVDSFPNDEEAFFYYSTCSEKNKWTIPTVFWRLKFDGSMFRPTPLEDDPESTGNWQIDFIPTYMLEGEIAKSAKRIGEERSDFIDRNVSMGLKIFMNYICFCSVLNEFHTEFVDTKPHEGHSKMRRALGKAPLFTYKVLTIGKKKRKSQKLGGTHASPRSHLRRGYYRTSRNGVRHWVQPCMVKGGTDGFVHKDYKVEGTVMEGLSHG
jgi:hypothetical protein